MLVTQPLLLAEPTKWCYLWNEQGRELSRKYIKPSKEFKCENEFTISQGCHGQTTQDQIRGRHFMHIRRSSYPLPNLINSSIASQRSHHDH